ncbi:hypothetical protein ACFVS2_20085 [Brevibacillus sp. NPDC058079]|uniref:hypothetical protein n=1 Tax=Brevibacillus sp. NPDC058079 TaxID=3346330 RepID=UPI0036E3521B
MMDRDLKFALGKVLGETYRLQKRVNEGMCQVSDTTIFGLLNGIESVIDTQLGVDDPITEQDIAIMANILNPYHLDRVRFEAFRGYYDIEDEIENMGIGRSKAERILTYFNSNGQFREIIQRMDSSHSPTECRRFDVDPDEV